jgi:hypothetical protein
VVGHPPKGYSRPPPVAGILAILSMVLAILNWISEYLGKSECTIAKTSRYIDNI